MTLVRRTRALLLAAAVAFAGLVAPAPASAASCVNDLAFVYTGRDSTFVVELEPSACGPRSAVGDLLVSITLTRDHQLINEVTTTQSNARCVWSTSRCVVTVTMTHAPVERARYEGSAAFRNTGPRLIRGSGWAGTWCTSVWQVASCVV